MAARSSLVVAACVSVVAVLCSSSSWFCALDYAHGLADSDETGGAGIADNGREPTHRNSRPARAGPPGTDRYLTGRRRASFELFVCGWLGHELIGVAAQHVRPEDALIARVDPSASGWRWLRCLRCDAWVPLPPPQDPEHEHLPAREEITVSLRGKGLRDKIVLRLIALDRALHFVILAAIATAIFILAAHRAELRTELYRVLADLQGGLLQSARRGHGLLHDINELLSLRSTKLHLLGAAVLAYALLEGVEAVGLWLQKRWAEYLTFIATALLLPLEVGELSLRFSVLKLATLVINLAIVAYLIFAKRLFGVRGGGRTDELARAYDQGWPALERTAPGR